MAGDKRGSRRTAKEQRSDEADFVARLRMGERDAEVEFFRRHRRQVAANLYRVLGQQAEIEDLVQEVFVIAFRGIHRFRGEARLSTWLYRIAVNVALGQIRTRTRKPPPLLMSDPHLELRSAESAPPPKTPRQELESHQDRDLCYRLLESLAPKKRIVLYLHEFEGRDLREIAEIVGANPVTVRTRLFYARKEFFKLAQAALEARDEESA